MKTYRVLITGSRYMTDPEPIRYALVELYTETFIGDGTKIVVVHGAGRGCDSLVDDVLDGLEGWSEAERHVAQWKRYGDGAGPIRNSKMAKLGANICFAFPCPRSVGTWDMVKKIALTGCEVHVRPLRKREYTAR